MQCSVLSRSITMSPRTITTSSRSSTTSPNLQRSFMLSVLLPCHSAASAVSLNLLRSLRAQYRANERRCQVQMRNFLERLLERVAELRENMSVSAFARKIGLNQKSVDQYVKGERKPSAEFLFAVCSKCGVSADWLLGLTDTRTGAGPVVTATGGSAASGTGPATVHAPPAVAPPGPAETDRLLTIIESQQRVIETLSQSKK